MDPQSVSPHCRRILVLGPDEGSRETILEPLRWELWDARGCSCLDETGTVLKDWKPQIVLLDCAPQDGQPWLAELRAKLPHASVIFLSERADSESIVAGLDGGADDYIIKPFVPLEMLARIRTHLRIRDLQAQIVEANEKLRELVDTDDLTGLFNMRSLYQRLEFEIERGRRFGRGVCVVMMDMDNFKTVNDGHDHLFGSFVLSEVGKLVRSSTRNIDIPARYGGDEFLIVLSELNRDGAMLFCERFRRLIEKTEFNNGEDSICLTISIGFAMMDPGEAVTPRELVRRADHALYQAKRTGRNRTVAYEGRGDDLQPSSGAITKGKKAS